MEARLFDAGTVPECSTAEWYELRDHAAHLEQPGHRERLLLASDMVHEAVERGAGSVCDLGAGDGGLLSLVEDTGVECWGYDLQQSNVIAAIVRGIDVSLQDVVAGGFVPGDCTVATEFLEHLVDPHGLVRQVAHDARWLVASSPYTETAGSHYPFHLWAWDQEGYRAMLESNGWKVLRQETAWICQVVLAERAV